MKALTWNGRTCAATIKCATESAHTFAYVLSSHLSPGDELPAFLADAAELMRGKPHGAKTLWLGDMNVDILPTLSEVLFRDLPGRDAHHAERRASFEEFMQLFGVQTAEPEFVDDSPASPWAAHCADVPITRIPTGEQAGFLAVLDYALVEQG